MSEWSVVLLSEVTSLIKRGRAPKYSDGGALVVSQKCVRPGNVLDMAPARRTDVSLKPIPDWAFLRAGDVLVNSTGRGTLGRACYVPSISAATTVDSHVSIVRADLSRAIPAFLGVVLSKSPEDLERLQAGSTNQTELSPVALGTLPLPLPPLVEQRRIVAVMATVDAQIQALEAEVANLASAYANGVGLLWVDGYGEEAPMTSLGCHMEIDIHRVRLDPEGNYRMAGVLNAGQGLIARETIKGHETDYSTLNRLRAGQVVMRKLTAWEGTLAVVPPAFDGSFASNEFPTFSFGPSMVAGYFAHVCRSPRLWHEMRNRVTGTVQRRKRLNPDQLLDVMLPIPEVGAQVRAAGVLDSFLALRSSLAAELGALRILRADLLTALLSQSITVDDAADRFVEGAA